MNSEEKALAIGFLAGVAASAVALYLGAPAIARKVSSRAVANALGDFGITGGVAQRLSGRVGDLAADETRRALWNH